VTRCLVYLVEQRDDWAACKIVGMQQAFLVALLYVRNGQISLTTRPEAALDCCDAIVPQLVGNVSLGEPAPRESSVDTCEGCVDDRAENPTHSGRG
jgi:hypothetical protein